MIISRTGSLIPITPFATWKGVISCLFTVERDNFDTLCKSCAASKGENKEKKKTGFFFFPF